MNGSHERSNQFRLSIGTNRNVFRILGSSVFVVGALLLIACGDSGGSSGAQESNSTLFVDGAELALDKALHLTVDLNGDVYVTDAAGNNALQVSAAGAVTSIIGPDGDGAANILSEARGVAVDGDGNAFIADFGPPNASENDCGEDEEDDCANVFKVTPSGTVTSIIDETGDGSGNSLHGATAVAVDLAGNVYVAGTRSDNVFKITPGGIITEIIDATGEGTGNTLHFPWSLAVDANGNVFVVGGFSNNVFKITAGGTVTEIIDSSAAGPGTTLDEPRGVAVDTGGNVYVATGHGDTTGIHSVYKITPGGTITEIIDATGDGVGKPLHRPFGVAVDDSDNVYVAGYDSRNVFKITPGGTITEIINETGDGNGNSLDFPFGVATDPNSGDVYVLDLNSNVFRIAIP